MNLDTNKLSSAVRLALTLGAVATAGVVGSAMAQDTGTTTPPSSTKAKELQTIVVTGSRIRRVDVETANPIFTISRQTIQQSGAVTLGNLVQSTPAISGDATNPSVNNGGGDGAATISLRGLGVSRTLVLIDGHRMAIDPNQGAPDINTIPAALVERVEILKDGASSIYGSSAIGGVVNFIMRKNFQGAEFSTNYGISDHSDGARRGASVMFGESGERGSIVAGISYEKTDGISSANRSFSRKALYLYYGQILPFGSSRVPNGRIVYPGNPNALTCITGTTCSSLSDFRTYSPTTDSYNYQAQNLILVPSERTNVFFMGQYHLSDNVSAFMDFFGNKTTSHSALAPSLADTGIPSPLVISAQSIYNPFGVEFSNASGNRFEYRFSGLGQRIFQFGTETNQIITGLKGDVGSTSWQWDANLNYSRVSTGVNDIGFVNLAAADQAFGPSYYNNGVPTCGTSGNPIVGCTPINIFDANSPSQTALLQQYESHPFTQTIYITRQASVNANGDLFTLPGGTVRLAVGADYRKRYTSGMVSSDIQINPATGTCALGTGCASSVQGGFNVKEAYAEVLVPLLKDVPFAHSLNVDIASRYSKYSLAGSTTNSKISMAWRPINDLLLRGTVAQVFRAPSISDLFAGPANSAPTFVDPCAGYIPGVSPASENNACGAPTGATAIPATGIAKPTVSQTSAIVSGSQYANYNLKPEFGKSFDFGFVYDPHWLPGFSTSVDLWRIYLNDTIVTANAQVVADQCFSDPASSLCALIHRFPNGQVSNIFSPVINLGRLDTSGIDFGFRYHLPHFNTFGVNPGNFTVVMDGTWTRQFTDVPVPGMSSVPIIKAAGQFNQTFGNFARWRGLGSLYWDRGPWNAMWRMRYVGHIAVPIQDFGSGVFTTFHFGAYVYNDFSVGYDIAPINTKLQIGVNNAFNKQPPIFTQNVVINANTDVNTYDVIGRYYWASATVKF
ncbi:TonB-dependent receptor [Metallibacterium sp.]|uniref:TonB-dependent receptor n=1 Tax=Metallibacterium sp. TaxID=2940281 RepID=UPI0026085CFE|nr:TonB-dependent receptor [Metallibacterium sp.]